MRKRSAWEWFEDLKYTVTGDGLLESRCFEGKVETAIRQVEISRKPAPTPLVAFANLPYLETLDADNFSPRSTYANPPSLTPPTPSAPNPN